MKATYVPPPEALKVFETLPELYVILSPDLRVLFANQAYLQATHTTADAIAGRPIFEVFPDTPDGNEIALVEASLQQVLTTRQPHCVERLRYDLPATDTSDALETRYWRGYHTPVLDEANEIQYIIERVSDITQEVENEAHLQALEQDRQRQDQTERQLDLLQTVLDQSPVAMCLFQGSDLVVASANRLICDLWGYPTEQVLGRPLLEAVPELQGQGFDALIIEVMKTGVPYRGYETPARMLRDGALKTTYYNFVYQPLHNEQGEIIGVVDVAVEVTEQVEARQQIEEARRKEQELNEKLASSNEELQATNDELAVVKNSLEQLNRALEEQVEHRAQQLQQAQKETDRQKDRMERFFLQAPVAICILDGPELTYELVNPAYQQLFPGRGLLGKPLLEALPELADQSIWPVLQNVYHTAETFEGREVLIPLARREGEPLEDIYFNFVYQPRFNKQQAVDGILVLAYDVTEQVLARQKAEQLGLKVEQQAQTFDITLAALQDFVYTFDTKGRFTYANLPLLNLLGITLEHIIGKSFHELPYPTALADTLQAHIAQVVTTGQPLSDETPYTNPEGKLGYYEYIFQPVFDLQQQVIAVAGYTRDITERKRSEEVLRLKNDELIRTNVDLDNFIYTASHDLKAPISNIESLLTALLRTLPAESMADKRIQRITSMMQGSVERFKGTIANLTEIVKLQKENSEEATWITLADVVEEVRLDLAPMIRASGVQLTIGLTDCPSVRFSKKNLRSVVYNLLSNAIKYRSPERTPEVWVSCDSTPEYHVLTVKDNGLGMEARRLSQLFTMFKRFHDHVEGTGIGLYMVKKIVENAGGHIEVDSKVDVGSTFRVSFKR